MEIREYVETEVKNLHTISGNTEISGLVSHIQIEFCIINIVAFFFLGNIAFVSWKDT
jgi:hypothetical protein